MEVEKRGIKVVALSFTQGYMGPRQRWGGTSPQRQYRLLPTLFLLSNAVIVSFTGKDGESLFMLLPLSSFSSSVQMLK